LDQRAIIDVVCRTGAESLGREVGALLGRALNCTVEQLDIVTKEQLFSDPARPKGTLARLTVSGDVDGDSYLLVPTSTAAILGGTLIMLPEDMIEQHASNEELDNELDDAYGEVANIIAGVFTQAFVDKYKHSLRFIKKSLEPLIPTKIDNASETPFPPGNYHLTRCSLSIDDQALGNLELIVPASIFALEQETPTTIEEQPAPEPIAPPAETTQIEPPAKIDKAEEPEVPTPPKKRPFAEAKKLIDVIFTAVVEQLGDEVGALLGQPLQCSDLQLQLTTKEELFSNHCQDISILTQMQVSGDREGLGYLIVQTPDAIIMGGTLIMLPEDQIEEQRSSGKLEGEAADAYGEIANIVAGSLTHVFDERYPQKIRYVRMASETLVPTKIDIASDEPFPQDDYYVANFSLSMEGHELNRALLVFPAAIFGLEGQTNSQAASKQKTNENQPAPGEWGGPPLEEASAKQTQAAGSTNKETVPSDGMTVAATGNSPNSHPKAPLETGQQGDGSESHSTTAPSSNADPIVIIIADHEETSEPFTQTLSAAGYNYQVISYQEDIKSILQQLNITGIFLIMSKVGEKGFATAIKLQSAAKALPPIIFAGPDWTKTTVLRAVKYGAKDILVLPASDSEIQAKVAAHLKKAS
jgi:chemotaxis protein CheY-P-specific phosphatase CheC/CheY-like chemotaxis protein